MNLSLSILHAEVIRDALAQISDPASPERLRAAFCVLYETIESNDYPLKIPSARASELYDVLKTS